VASRQLDEPAYLAAAERTFAVITARFVNPEDGSVRRLIDSEALGSPTDFLAVAWGCLEFSRLTQREDAATLGRRLVARAQELFFDPELNRFMAATSPLPPGLFVRAPAVADPLTAEALALMANAPDGLRTAIGQRLTATLNTTGTLPPGDVLLSLAP
jgi:uncharacterized protein YyaL (SSP411 family)